MFAIPVGRSDEKSEYTERTTRPEIKRELWKSSLYRWYLKLVIARTQSTEARTEKKAWGQHLGPPMFRQE